MKPSNKITHQQRKITQAPDPISPLRGSSFICHTPTPKPARKNQVSDLRLINCREFIERYNIEPFDFFCLILNNNLPVCHALGLKPIDPHNPADRHDIEWWADLPKDFQIAFIKRLRIDLSDLEEFKIKNPGLLKKNYHTNNSKKGLDSGVINLLKKIKKSHEIEIIYDFMEKRVGFSGRIIDRELKLKEAALNCFRDTQNQFEYVQEKYLIDKKIFSLSDSNTKRDFFKAILIRIVHDHIPGKYSQKQLIESYMKIPSNKRHVDKSRQSVDK